MNAKVSAQFKRTMNVMISCNSRYYRAEDISCARAGGLSPERLRYRGLALVWSALLLLLMIGFVGLSIDWAKVALNVHQMQNAADAAALAGAQIVKISPADVTRLETHELAFANRAEQLEVTLRKDPPYQQAEPFVDDTDLDIILGRWITRPRPGWFFATLDTPDAVKAIARRTDGLADAPALAMLFGPIFGVDTTNARRDAVGWHNAISGAGLIVLDTEPHNLDPPYNVRPGLKIADNVGNIEVIGGTIHVNAVWTGTMDDAAVYVKAGGHMACGRLTLTGNTYPASDSIGDWGRIWTDVNGIEMPYDVSEGAPYLPDPLRQLVPPPIPTNPDGTYVWKSYNEVTDGSATLEPGYYPNGIAVRQSQTVLTLNPGTYLIGGGNPPGNQIDGLYLNGGTVIGHGVLIYLTKDYVHADGKWAQLDIRGEVVVDITPPGDYMSPRQTEGLPGISFWQDRANLNTACLGGEGDMMISGTLYFPNNHIYLAGNPGKAGNQILCGSLEVFGRATVIVEYDGRNNLHAGRSILVQ